MVIFVRLSRGIRTMYIHTDIHVNTYTHTHIHTYVYMGQSTEIKYTLESGLSHLKSLLA